MAYRTGLVIGVIAATALLAGCDKPADGRKAADAGAAAGPASATVSEAVAAPRRKAGLWEQKVATQGFEQVSTICVDPASEKEMSAFGQQMARESKCSEQRFSRRLDGGLEFSSVCPMGEGGTIASRGVVSGDFNASYQVTVKSTTTGAPAPQMNGEHEMAMTATWKGPCPSDMKPGDIRLAGTPGMPGAAFNPSAMAGSGHAPGAADMERMRKSAEAMRRQAGQ